MTMLARVENVIRQAGVPCKRNELGLMVQIPSSFKALIYPVLLSEQEGSLEAFVWFPRCKGPAVEKVGELCSILRECLEVKAQIGFHPDRHAFWVGTSMDPAAIGNGLEEVAEVCDHLYPLCKHVEEKGEWDNQLIELALGAVEGQA